MRRALLFILAIVTLLSCYWQFTNPIGSQTPPAIVEKKSPTPVVAEATTEAKQPRYSAAVKEILLDAQDRVKAAEKRIATLTADMQMAEVRVEHATGQIARWQKELKESRDAQTRATDSIKTLTKRLAEYQDDQKVGLLTKQLADARADLVSHEKNANELRKGIEDSAAMLAKARDTTNILQIQLHQAKADHARQIATRKNLELAAITQSEERVRELDFELNPPPKPEPDPAADH